MATVSSNAKFAKELVSICEGHDIDTSWATIRQASKFRMKKGRIYAAMRAKIQERRVEGVKA